MLHLGWSKAAEGYIGRFEIREDHAGDNIDQRESGEDSMGSAAEAVQHRAGIVGINRFVEHFPLRTTVVSAPRMMASRLIWYATAEAFRRARAVTFSSASMPGRTFHRFR